MDCPVCSIPLIVVEHRSIELDYCIECKGLWFDRDELDLLKEKLELDGLLPKIDKLPRVETKEKYRRCPRCGKKMEKAYLGEDSSVVIDRCPKGEGFWLDRGELGLVVDHYRKDGDEEGELINFLGETFSGGTSPGT